MDKETLNMHKTFLQTVRTRITEAEVQLTALRAVEKFHADIVNTGSKTPKNDDNSDDFSISGNNDLSSKKRHIVALMALKNIGHSATIPEIAKWLRSYKFEPKMEENILRSSLFTSMNRHPELFKRTKTDAGKTLWEVVSGE